MESVIGTKMQYNPGHLSAFRAGAYVLNGPDGPITPADWDKKICPGCVVELRLTGLNQTLELIGPRHTNRGPRSPSRAEGTRSVANQSFTSAPLRRVDTDHQIELPGFPSTRKPPETFDSESCEGHGQTSTTQSPEETTAEPIPTREKPPHLRHPSPAQLSSDVQGFCLDSFLKPPGHDTGPNPSAESDQHLGISPKPVRRATDLQSFVEDADGDSYIEKGSLTSIANILSPVEDPDFDLRESADRQNSTISFGPDQPILELGGNTMSQERAENLHSLNSKQESSAEADAGREKRHLESTNTSKDSVDAASLEPKDDMKAEFGVPHSSSGAETTPLCPIFAWKLEATDGLPATPSEKSEPIPDQYRDMDRTIRAILEERDAEANIYLLTHERESFFIDSLSECSRIEVLARMKMANHARGLPLDAEYPAKKNSQWRRRQDIISDAMEILDAFVPVPYQNLHQYWLIKKFYGALLAFVTNEVSKTDPETISQLNDFSVY